ncbi:MAG TPA: ATP-binding protein [Kofleriaceae bacterium]|nr:ATP-binding protein [Kofleriaceae bacterium]
MSLDDVFAGGGHMGARMRDLDWSRTPLGPPASWPQSLKTCVRIILTSRQPMFVWWGEQLINLYNDAYRAILGGKHPAALAQPASQVWSEIWDEAGPRAATAMRANEGTYDESLLLIMERNGYPEETYYTFSYSPVPNERGGPGGILCANTDDTGRIVGERQLALLRDLAARTADARSLDEMLSRAAAALAGATRDLPFAAIYLASAAGPLELARAIGITPAGLAPIEAAPALAQMAEAPDAMRVITADPAWPLPSGAWPRPPHQIVLLPIAASGPRGRAGVLAIGANPFRLLDGAYRGFLELAAGQLAASLASVEAYEQELRRAEALAEIDRAKTAFFSNVSHEFRTPLTLMLGPQEDALRAPGGALTGDALAGVHRNTLRLLKLVNSLLDFSRIEAGRVQASYAPVDLAALTRELAATFRAAIERAGLRLRVACEALDEPIFVDREMWEKIVLNLLSNAFKFTFEGEIAVELARAGGHVELRVADTGVGIAAADLPRVFERFHRVEGVRARTHEGTGIGLALVQDLVKLHGGTIDATSTPGVGTTFRVRIPRGAAHLPADRLGGARTHAGSAATADAFVAEATRWLPAPADEAAAPPLIPGRVLVVDDNADMRDYVTRLLREHGWQVDAARDGGAALRQVRAAPPDLVLTDIMMPEVDGFALLRALRDDPVTALVPVVMLSARAGEEARVDGLAAGADDYLVKPFSARELIARVTTHLQLGRLRREAVRANHQLLDLVMQSPIAMSLLEGPELRYVIVNARYREMVARDHLIGRTIAEVFPEVVGTPLMAVFHRVYETGEPFVTDEYPTRLRRHGVLADCYFQFSTVAVRASDGTITGIMATAVEVTEQVRTRRALELSEGRLRRVIDSNVVGFAALTLDGCVRDANDYFLGLLGVTRDELRAAPIRLLDFTPPELHARSLEAMRELRETGVCEPYEKSYLRRDGRRVPVVVGSTLVPGGGEAISFVLDISARKRIEEQNVVLRAQAESANRAKDEFLAMLGHELRNPLAPILTALNLMRLRGNDAVEKERTVIERQAQHLVHLVDDLLDVSRITRGKIELKRVRVELAEVVARAIEMASPLIEQRRHELVVEVAPRGLALDADPARLAQVVANLLTNAAKYTEPGGRITVTGARRDPGDIALVVRDTGIGIAPEMLPHVFDLFVQERQNLDRSQGGLGLGLAIVRSMVELHAGTVAVSSAGHGYGSEFTISLPAAEGITAPEIPAVVVETIDAAAERRRVLVVDDNEDAAALLAEYLEAMGNTTRVAHDGAQALRLVEDFVPELALLDIGLPVMDGYELAQQLRARLGHDHLRLIAVTGYGQESDRQKAKDASFDAHLVKPIDFARLDQLLARG